jgi:hypothetical protein
MSKYGNHKTTVDGITFDSQKEANRYCELKLLQKAHKISGLELQKVFVLIPPKYEVVYGKRGAKRGKCIERACTYKADFTYYDIEDDMWVVEDVKGMKTDVYKIKKKLMLYQYGIRIREI